MNRRTAGLKHVHYWSARQLGDGDVSDFRPTGEVDKVAWFSQALARKKLTYAPDVQLLDTFAESAYRCDPLVCFGMPETGLLQHVSTRLFT